MTSPMPKNVRRLPSRHASARRGGPRRDARFVCRPTSAATSHDDGFACDADSSRRLVSPATRRIAPCRARQLDSEAKGSSDVGGNWEEEFEPSHDAHTEREPSFEISRDLTEQDNVQSEKVSDESYTRV